MANVLYRSFSPEIEPFGTCEGLGHVIGARLSSILAVLFVLVAPCAARAAGLPLGPGSLEETRVSARPAPGVTWTRIVRAGGPWRVNVLAVERPASVSAALSGKVVAGRESVSAMVRRGGAVAGVNGGYFAVDGDPVGVLAAGGRLVSEPVEPRSALVFPASGSPRVSALGFSGSVTLAGTRRLLDGINRVPGRIPGCGGRGGDRPTQLPSSSLTCTDTSELVLFTPEYGAPTPSGAGRLDVVVRAGQVVRTREGGGTLVPRDGHVLGAVGPAAGLLRRLAQRGAAVSLDLSLLSSDGPLAPAGYSSIVGGGPRLLARGRVALGAGPEGFGEFDPFVAARNPRTLAGVRADGSLLLVTIDGRRAGWSAGVTLLEAARVMRHLGARDALNLDGGGSSVMVVGRRVVNRPSDAAGQRAVSDALLVLP